MKSLRRTVIVIAILNLVAALAMYLFGGTPAAIADVVFMSKFHDLKLKGVISEEALKHYKDGSLTGEWALCDWLSSNMADANRGLREMASVWLATNGVLLCAVAFFTREKAVTDGKTLASPKH